MSIKDPEELGHWKQAKDEAEFRGLVDELAGEFWSPRPEPVSVPTSFGDVVVHRLGHDDGTPVVLLPGFGAPALMYRPELVQAINGRPVLLVETIGDVGASSQTAPIRDADDEATWITEVLDGLHIARAHVVGTSFGGWLALNLALRAPQRVSSVVGIEPVWERISARAMVRGLPVLLAGLAPAPIRARAAVRYHQPLLADPRLRRLGRLAFTRFVNGHPRPEFLTDEQLGRIMQPALILLGADSQVTSPEAVRARLSAALPTATVEIVEDAGHSLPVEHPGAIGERIARFVSDLQT
jgi:pimeloyl-ACP methyl ester carboxylesterase